MRRFLKSGSPSEDSIQATFFRWVFYQQNLIPELRLCFAIPNGGSRNKLEAVKLKRMGVRRGVPDVLISVARGKWHGCYIEFKSETGKQSQEQYEMSGNLFEQDYYYAICKTWQEAVQTTERYLRGDL